MSFFRTAVSHGFNLRGRGGFFHKIREAVDNANGGTSTASTSQASGGGAPANAHRSSPSARGVGFGSNHFLNALKSHIISTAVTSNLHNKINSMSGGISQSSDNSSKDNDLLKKLNAKDGSGSQFANDFIR